MVLVHLVVEGCGSNRSARLKDAQLLLIKYLRICEALVSICLAKMGRSHYLLRHHQVVSLRPVDSFLTLNGADAKLGTLEVAAAHLTD
jgi:hypothetical protein